MSQVRPTLEPPHARSDKLSLREEFARALSSDLPRCPDCHKMLTDREISACDFCGFSIDYLAKHFPTEGLPTLLELQDFSNTLNDAEMDDISQQLNVIKKRYPQFFIKICLLPLQKDVLLYQMALWMLNQCPMPEDQSDRDKDWTVLILTDSVSLKTSITTGYSAEIFFPAENSLSVVAHLDSSSRKGLHARAYLEALDSILNILDSSKQGVKKQFKIFKKKQRK